MRPEMSQRDQALYQMTMREFAQYQVERWTFAAQWEDSAALIMPSFRNTFTYGSFSFPGSKKTEMQVDSTGMMANARFGAICDSLLTPRNMRWHEVEADNPYLMKQRGVKLWFQEVTRRLFQERYRALAAFSGNNQANFKMVGAFGNGFMMVDRIGGGKRGLRYKSIPLGQMYIHENHQGIFDGYIRWFRMTASQAYQMIKNGIWPEQELPPVLKTALEASSTQMFNFLHRVMPRDLADYDPERLDYRGKAYSSCYISIEGQCVMHESGYVSMPTSGLRYERGPDEVYGRGPAQQVLPALKTLNAEKRIFLKQGHRAADPVLLLRDDGIMDMNLRPGAQNKGAMSDDGKPLVGVLPTGDIAISEEMMQEERQLINDAFLVSLFQILTETPTMTATEVIERTNEKGILIAPTVGQMQNDYLGPMISRELDVLAMEGLLPPMPGVIREAQGEWNPIYTGPLARQMRAQEAAGFYRTLEPVREIVNITQDPAPLDNFDFDTAIPEIAWINNVPEMFMASEEMRDAKRANRAKAQARQEQIQAAPAAAAMMKAQTDRMEKAPAQQ